MNENNTENITENSPEVKFNGKRPPGLTILCILSFIGSGGSAISSFFVAGAFNLIPLAVKQTPVADAEALLKMITTAGPLFFFFMGILYLISLAGAIYMFKLRKTGFHLYTVAQLCMLILPSLMISGFELPVSNLLLTGSFILAYAVNIRLFH